VLNVTSYAGKSPVLLCRYGESGRQRIQSTSENDEPLGDFYDISSHFIGKQCQYTNSALAHFPIITLCSNIRPLLQISCVILLEYGFFKVTYNKCQCYLFII
jgi:hypothetical protein